MRSPPQPRTSVLLPWTLVRNSPPQFPPNTWWKRTFPSSLQPCPWLTALRVPSCLLPVVPHQLTLYLNKMMLALFNVNSVKDSETQKHMKTCVYCPPVSSSPLRVTDTGWHGHTSTPFHTLSPALSHCDAHIRCVRTLVCVCMCVRECVCAHCVCVNSLSGSLNYSLMLIWIFTRSFLHTFHGVWDICWASTPRCLPSIYLAHLLYFPFVRTLKWACQVP